MINICTILCLCYNRIKEIKERTTMIKDKEITSSTIADFFLTKESLTPKKVQKLVYYAYAWFIALNNQDAENIENVFFDEVPEAWMHGPVFHSLYQRVKEYGWHEIPKRKDDIKFENEDIESFLNIIWKKFGRFSADDLEFMTHQETPWRNARKDIVDFAPSAQKIQLKDIFTCYNEKLSA